MTCKPILVVMAAGMGSRYGSLKQIDPIGPCGEAILDYSIYDAIEAGFKTVVLIIKESIKELFMETVLKRLRNAPIEIKLAFQEINAIPERFIVPEDRTKPWGTGHAVLCAKEAIGDSPFVVINADDYYGKSAYKMIYNYLSENSDANKYNYCMVGYALSKTVTENGFVSRGICDIGEDGYLNSIVERTRIESFNEGIHYTNDEGITWTKLSDDTIVSMNMWGFTPSLIHESELRFSNFLEHLPLVNPLKTEFFLPTTVSELLEENKASVKVLSSNERWFGVTYAEDKQIVKDAIQRMITEGAYPNSLWKNSDLG